MPSRSYPSESRSLLNNESTDSFPSYGATEDPETSVPVSPLSSSPTPSKLSRADLAWVLSGLWSAVFLGALDGQSMSTEKAGPFNRPVTIQERSSPPFCHPLAATSTSQTAPPTLEHHIYYQCVALHHYMVGRVSDETYILPLNKTNRATVGYSWPQRRHAPCP